MNGNNNKPAIQDLLNEIKKDGKSWMQETEGLPENAIIWAENFAKFLSKNERQQKLSTTQLRKFFGEMKKIQAMGFDLAKMRFRMLKPQIAYAVGRDYDKRANRNKSKIKDYYDAIHPLISDSIIQSKNQFKNFVQLNEAIVAYHKALTGE